MLQGKLNLSTDNPFYGKWNNLVNIVSSAFHLTEKERIALYKSRIARLIAAIPYLAGCEDVERTAISHLGIYMFTIRTRNFFCTGTEEIKGLFKRMRMINNYLGGKTTLLERGMNLILLNILAEYEHDLSETWNPKKQDPMIAGIWYLKEEKDDLIKRIKAVNAPYMDEIITIEQAMIEWW